MEIHIHIHHHHDEKKLDEVLAGQNKIISLITTNQKIIMADLSELEARVAKDTEVDASAITLLNGLKSALDAAGTDPVKLKALSDQLGTNSTALAAAVVANTPAQ